MESFILSLNAVMPTFLLISAGYALKRVKIISKNTLSELNRMTFLLFLPVMLFSNTYRTDFRETFQGPVILFALVSLLILFLVLCILVPVFVKDHKRRGVVIQGIFRSNYVIFGVSIITNLYGSEQAGLAAVLSAFLVPMYNFLAVIALAVFTHKGKISIRQIIKSIITNPLIIAAVLGTVVSLSGIRFPAFLDTTISQTAALATPLALLVLGGDFEFSALRGRIATAAAVSAIKLVVVPGLTIPIAVRLGFTGVELMSLVLATASPVAVSSYIMAQQAKADHELAGQIVLVSSVFCLITMFGWVYFLSLVGLV